jgi:RNA polymerase sigma factor (sigma-70 family)
MKHPQNAVAAEAPGVAHTTCWSVVLEAAGSGPGAASALEVLCRRYWPPVFGFFLRAGLHRAAAEDETQEFFADLLRRESLAGVGPERGKFRAFLLACLKHHMASVWRDAARLKRGGGEAPVLLDAALADSIAGRVEGGLEPEVLYDRQWADAVMQNTLERLSAEYRTAGRGARFAVLKDYLMWDGGGNSGRELAAALGESETAVRSGIFRMRRRFGLLLREEVGATLGPGEDVEQEVRYLARVLGQ